MPDFRILDVLDHDCHLAVKVQHLHDDGSSWYVEHYLFQGREGLKHKRSTNAAGRLLMDNDEEAPEGDSPEKLPEEAAGPHNQAQFLPEGREWKRNSEPHLHEESILNAIRQHHIICSEPDAPVQQDDVDRQGCEALAAYFQYLRGYQE